METSKTTLKLLINKTERKVLFAEADKDFVDFLFYVLSLPVGTIINLLKNKNTGWCLGDLYRSIESLSETYIQSNESKNSVLNPKSPLCPNEIPLLSLDNSHEPNAVLKFFSCPNSNHYSSSHLYVADAPSRSCPGCDATMNHELTFVPPECTTAADAERGFVKGVVTYMVMDNLEVTPMSTISCITLPIKFKVMDLSALEEQVVDFGIDEGLKLLKASMECKNVLTSVFLGNMED
ncbi:hypothetical protein KPL71_011818 [Citrus sinensis]|uniref:Uncharacterized protein n=1 Tax=Citrus sinensis TaxID=2711 RepID=A0ACB8L6F0_CITSI|nr:hypothetical protein KPL71_011818 [Citrus sinensis]